MRFVLLLIAAVIAVVAGIAALQWSGKNVGAPTATTAPTTQNGPVPTVEILVARAPIPVGTILDDSMVDRQPWPENLVLEGFIVTGTKNADITGKVARVPFLAHEPLMQDKLANPNDPSFLAANLPEGMRAVTIATDAVAGVAGYVFPGDRIDILFTHNVPKEIKVDEHPNLMSRSNEKPAISEVLVPDVRVLAVNVREAPGRTTSQTTTPSSVTVEVSNFDAERLRLAEKIGTLSVALRSLHDQDKKTVPDVAELPNLTRASTESHGESIRVIHGIGRSEENTPVGPPMGGAPVPGYMPDSPR